jgi:hypothetical protein
MKIVTICLIAGALVAVILTLLTMQSDQDFTFVIMLTSAMIASLTFYVASNLSGTNRSAKVPKETREDWLALNAPKGGAAVYFIRTGVVGKLAGMDVTVNGRPSAQLKSSQFTRIDVPAGSVSITASMSGGAGKQAKDEAVHLDLSGGEIAILHLVLSMGALKNQVKVKQLSPTSAAPMLKSATAVEPNFIMKA